MKNVETEGKKMRMMYTGAISFLLCFSVAMVFVSHVYAAEWRYLGEWYDAKYYCNNDARSFEEHRITGKRVWTKAEGPSFEIYSLVEVGCSERVFRNLGSFRVREERHGEFDKKGPNLPDSFGWVRIPQKQDHPLGKLQRAVCQ